VAPALLLASRLRDHGLPAGIPVRTHRNRRVMVSWTARGGVRVHEGYAFAPDPVVRAIVRFVHPRAPRAERRVARRLITGFPAAALVPSRPRREAPPPEEDRPVLARLEALHAEFNALHFGGALGPLPVRLSGRMRTRLGELACDAATGRPVRITLSRRHLRRDGWARAGETLLHEMVHQWQAETGRRLGHGAEFRAKARAVGIAPSARVDLSRPRGVPVSSPG